MPVTEESAEATASAGGVYPVNVERGEVAVPSSSIDGGWAVARLSHAAEEMAESLMPGRQVGQVFHDIIMATGTLGAREVTAILWAALEAGFAEKQGKPIDQLGPSRFRRANVVAIIEELGRIRAEEIVTALLVLAAPRREVIDALGDLQSKAGARPLSETVKLIATGERAGVNFAELWSEVARSLLAKPGA